MREDVVAIAPDRRDALAPVALDLELQPAGGLA
jgi:hypothetical protein